MFLNLHCKKNLGVINHPKAKRRPNHEETVLATVFQEIYHCVYKDDC
jgi:hypothetical protein